MDTKDLYSSNTPEIDQAQGTFLKEFYYYDTIENHIAKVKVPKKVEKERLEFTLPILAKIN